MQSAGYTSQTQRVFIATVLLCTMLLPLNFAHGALLYGSETRAKIERKSAQSERATSTPWLMSYYVGYQNGYLKPRDVDYSLMTHIVVGGVGVRADGTLDEHWHLSNGDGRAMALEVKQRAQKEGVKALVWLGGPNEEDKFFSASSPAYRAVFVRNIVKLVREIGYDGVDINWEPIRPADEPYLLALVKDLRKADPTLLITVPVNWVQLNTVKRANLSYYKELATYADRLFIMSYSMAGAWPGWQSWHAGALGGQSTKTPGSVESSVDAYRKAGVPKEKLGIGIGTYATCWKYPVKKPKQNVPDTFTSKSIGVMSMRTMMDDYYTKRAEKWDSKAQVPYLSFTRRTGDMRCGFISYENERSVKAKASYVTEERLGGAMVWNIGTGYYPDARTGKKHPLLQTLYTSMFPK
jgi:chitinase